MNSTTYTRRYDNLVKEISIHPHKDEILDIMYQQLQDDSDKVNINIILN